MPTGSKLWRLKYRYEGKEKLLSLGPYPLVLLIEARAKRDEARKQLIDGIDPAVAKKEKSREEQLKAETTFMLVACEWHELYKERWSAGHAATVLHRMENDIFPDLGARPIGEITASELLSVIRKIEDRGAHEMARRATQICGQVFRYAIITDRAERNPAADLKGALKPVRKGHYAALDVKDLPAFLQALERNDARLYQETRLAMKLLALTFVRTGELIGATWDEFDLDGALWVIPAERMKMRKTHYVPLSRQAIAILGELKERGGNRAYILPSQIHSKKHMSNNTILKALERMGYKDEMTGHGFRALAMTAIKEKLGYRHEVVDKADYKKNVAYLKSWTASRYTARRAERDALYKWRKAESYQTLLAYGYAGNDTIQADGASAKFYGGDGYDALIGDYLPDLLYGEAGDDYLDDQVCWLYGRPCSFITSWTSQAAMAPCGKAFTASVKMNYLLFLRWVGFCLLPARD